MTGTVRISAPFELIPLAEWMERGACVGMDTNKFYPPSETDTRSAYVTEAKAICKPCPVRTECLNWALRYEEQGLWGGTTQTERERMKNPERKRISQRSINKRPTA